MKKDFDAWNEAKKRTDTERPRFYTVREIWWCRLGLNVGTEQDGNEENFVRPVLILRGFGANACLVAPLTTSRREHPLRVSAGVVDGKEARVNLSQIRVIDARRLGERITILDKETFQLYEKPPKTCFSGFPKTFPPKGWGRS